MKKVIVISVGKCFGELGEAVQRLDCTNRDNNQYAAHWPNIAFPAYFISTIYFRCLVLGSTNGSDRGVFSTKGSSSCLRMIGINWYWVISKCRASWRGRPSPASWKLCWEIERDSSVRSSLPFPSLWSRKIFLNFGNDSDRIITRMDNIFKNFPSTIPKSLLARPKPTPLAKVSYLLDQAVRNFSRVTKRFAAGEPRVFQDSERRSFMSSKIESFDILRRRRRFIVRWVGERSIIIYKDIRTIIF